MTQPAPFDALDDLSREELRQRVRALLAILDRVPVPIAIAHDPECRFISANAALASLLHVPQAANVSLTPLSGEPLYRIQRNGKDIPPEELPMQYAIAHRAPVSNEIEIVRPDGSVVYVRNDVEPLYDTHGEIYGCVSVCVDVSQQKRSEVAYRDADRRKDEFLATLSHELRTPMAPIRTAVEVMRLARHDPALVEKARTTMERQLVQLVHLTDDLLDAARISQDKVELRREQVDLRTVLHNAIEAARPFIDAQNHILVFDAPQRGVWVDADPIRLAQVFSNLLNNAAKFTDRGGRIHLTLTSDGRNAKVTVIDNGMGIPAAMIPRVFDMFKQLQQSGERTHGGLGIGLTLARRIVELNGGTIEARSDGPGRGSTFVVTLPAIEPARAGARRVRKAVEAPAQGCRVLVAEDDPDSAEMMRLVLEMTGNDVRVALDGEEALALAETFDPQIAFIDIGMPRLDGYETARRMRRAFGERVVLVALTGWGQDEDKHRSREAGFDYHLTKPPEPDVIEGLIADCVKRRSA